MDRLNDLPSKEKEILASELFATLYAGLSISCPNEKIEKLDLNITNKDGYTEFRPTLLTIVNLCQDADTPKKRELLAKAYSWLGADYREKAIYYVNLFLDLDLDLKNREPYPLFVNGQEVLMMDRESQICYMKLIDLAKAYEGEYLFDLAYQTLRKAWGLFPYSYTILALTFNILRKMNNLLTIINVIDRELEEVWTQPYMHTDMLGRTFYRDSNRRCLLVDREKYTAMINRGYVYNPRPRNKK
ncbi:hypothetical protein [Longicatena caecimuris]|uniref:hypothetical protein n=1 Tax=Longicatena caecimuris TaxID=1796635 RepID=UPI003AB61F46